MPEVKDGQQLLDAMHPSDYMLLVATLMQKSAMHSMPVMEGFHAADLQAPNENSPRVDVAVSKAQPVDDLNQAIKQLNAHADFAVDNQLKENFFQNEPLSSTVAAKIVAYQCWGGGGKFPADICEQLDANAQKRLDGEIEYRFRSSIQEGDRPFDSLSQQEQKAQFTATALEVLKQFPGENQQKIVDGIIRDCRPRLIRDVPADEVRSDIEQALAPQSKWVDKVGGRKTSLERGDKNTPDGGMGLGG